MEKYNELYNREKEILNKLSVQNKNIFDCALLSDKFYKDTIDSVPLELLRNLIGVIVEKCIVK